MATRDYLLRMPPDTQVRAACEDVGCESWLYGWETHVDEGTDLGQRQAAYIRQSSGRTFTEHRSGAVTVFRFASRQRCFAEHRTRPARWLIRNGSVREAGASEWFGDLGDHMNRLNDQLRKG